MRMNQPTMARMLFVLGATVLACTTPADAVIVDLKGTPQLFMDPASDLVEPWGLLNGNPTALVANKNLTMPKVNYSAGATVFASFTTDSGSYEVFVAVGRPGEPIKGRGTTDSEVNRGLSDAPRAGGISVQRYTTTDFVKYSDPMTVLFLPNDTPSKGRRASLLDTRVGTSVVSQLA